MSAESNAEWIRWGEVDPFWGVASWDGKQAGSADAWTDEQFFEMGRQDWADFRNRWRGYGLTEGSVVEIGTGTGRMARAMAADFEVVHGVDVAPGMLAEAERVTADLPVELHLSDGLVIPLDDASVDAAFSTHVFQHFDSMELADANWKELARVLKPGGTLMVHLPVHYWPGGMEKLQTLYNARRRVGDFRAKVQRRKMAKGGAPIMRGLYYEWNALEATLLSLGFERVELSIIRMSSNNSQHACVLATRAAG